MKKQEPETILEVITRERGEKNSEKGLNRNLLFDARRRDTPFRYRPHT